MAGIGRLARICVLTLLTVLVVPGACPAQNIWGTCAVDPTDSPALGAEWRYRLDINWDTSGMGGHGMSHISFLLDIGICDCACDIGVATFDTLAGTGLGEGGCELSFFGLYECTGDPTFPDSGPTIKYEYVETGCEPGETGSATLYFYSSFAPGEPETHVDALGVKAGTAEGTGELVGVLPLCDCVSPVEGTSWGTVKSLYR